VLSLMQLLHWTTLEPGGPSNLAAVRFSSPVNVQLLKIFGPHERIFENDTSIISATEFPESHEEVVPTVQVFFTATPNLERDDKPKPLNQLATTTLHYDGGTRDFKIDMGTVSIAIRTVNHQLNNTISIRLPVTQPTAQVEDVVHMTPLAKYLDVANAKDYNALARSLCLEAAGDVSPAHLLRLMFLLKPADTDWEIPNYPARYADLPSLPTLELSTTNSLDAVHPKQRWLEQIMNELRFPIHDAEKEESIQRLADSFSTTLDTPEGVDLIGLLESDIRGEGVVLEKLVTCAANPSVADRLHKKMEALAKVKDNQDHSHNQEVSRLIERVNGWPTLIDSLTKPELDFSTVTPWIYDLLGDEETFAIFLQGLMSYEPVSELLKPVPEGTVKPLFSQPSPSSLEERKAFMRAIVGLGTLFPVFCWANSEGRHDSLQRIIHAFLIWQAEPGYGDVRNLSIGTSIGAESLLYRLYRSNTDVLFNPTFLDYLSSRSTDWPPLSDTVWLAKAASVGKQGIPKVLELLGDSDLSNNLRDAEAAYLFRVITRFLLKETTTQGEDYVLRSMWESMSPVQGVVHCLVDRLEDVSSALTDSVGALYISFTPESHLIDLIDAYVDILYLISHFGSVLPPVRRNIDQLVTSVINFETVCEILQMSRNIGNRLNRSIETITRSSRWFVGLFREDYFGVVPSCRFLKRVLLISHYPSSINVEKAFEVASSTLDHLLPQTRQGGNAHASVWAGRLVEELPLFQGFLHRNTEQQRARWILRATDLDGSEMGLGYFLLYDEISLLQLTLNKLQETDLIDPAAQALHFQVSIHFACLVTLVTSKESMSALLTSSEIATSLSDCYTTMSQLKLHDDSSVDLSKRLIETNEVSLVIAGA
ncbi:15427_t:CDS:2, partial [Acaulospora colombiana]